MSRKKKNSEKGKIGKFFSSVAKTGKSVGKSVMEATGPCAVCGKRTTTTMDYWDCIVLKSMNVDLKHMQGKIDNSSLEDIMTTRLYLHGKCYTSFFDKYIQESKVMNRQLNEECYELGDKHREISSELKLQIYDDSIQDNLSLIIASEEIMNFKDWEKNLALLANIESEIRGKRKIIERIHSRLKSAGVPNLKAAGIGHIRTSEGLRHAFFSGNFLAYAEMFQSSKSNLKLIQTKVLDYEYPEGSEVLRDLLQLTAVQIEKAKTMFNEIKIEITNLNYYRDKVTRYALKEIYNMERKIKNLDKNTK